MGRKRIDENKKKIRVSISLQKHLYDELKEKYPENYSKEVEKLIKKDLDKKP